MNPTLREIIDCADELYSKRNEIEGISRSIQLLQVSLDYETDWRLGRAFFFLGQQTSDRDKARAWHSQGVTASRRATLSKADRVEGHFWLGVNLALAAAGRLSISALRSALEARRELRKAIVIDESYHAAGPWRVLGRLNHKMPRFIGSNSVAEHAYENAMRLAPENTVTRIYFAELLLDTRRRDRARLLLESVVNSEVDPAWAFEIERDKKLALELLRNMAK